MKRLPWVIAAIAVLLGLLALVWPKAVPSPQPSAPPEVVEVTKTEATASAHVRNQVETSNQVVVTLRRKPKQQGGNQGELSTPSVDIDEEEITITVISTSSVISDLSASTGASTSATRSVIPSSAQTSPVEDYGRLGLVVGTFPGYLAVDYQLVRVDIPRQVLNYNLSLGLDAQANGQSVGLGLTLGNKFFISGAGWMAWNVVDTGVSIGVGLRF